MLRRSKQLVLVEVLSQEEFIKVRFNLDLPVAFASEVRAFVELKIEDVFSITDFVCVTFTQGGHELFPWKIKFKKLNIARKKLSNYRCGRVGHSRAYEPSSTTALDLTTSTPHPGRTWRTVGGTFQARRRTIEAVRAR